jgi:hypothetical protein
VDPAADQICGDASAIRRLLINLLSNALKHTTQGTIDVFALPSIDTGGRWIDLVEIPVAVSPPNSPPDLARPSPSIPVWWVPIISAEPVWAWPSARESQRPTAVNC